MPSPLVVPAMTATLLRDPPELKQFARRGDPPIERWPGRPITREDLMAACGDSRDWFRYGHRLQAYREAWGEFRDARQRRRKMSAGFDWNQILILGDFGTGKTTLGIKIARHYFGLGHPVFSNSSVLFGYHLEHEQMYTAMGFMPKNSLLLIDESSAALASRVGHNVAVASFAEMNLNTRKQSCTVIYMTAMDWEVAPSVRRSCKEVWMPVPKEDLQIEGGGPGMKPAEDPANFRLAWHVWDDYPYRKRNLIEGPDPDGTEGFGPPAYTAFDEGPQVQRAFLLNDTFELAQAGAATTADRDTVKGALKDYLGGQGPSSNGNGAAGAGHSERDLQLLAFFQEHEADPPQFFKPGQVARYLGVPSGIAGKAVQELIPVDNVPRKGYPSDKCYEELGKLYDREWLRSKE